ncbi:MULTISPECIES: DUF742 domain-containing protein [Streptomyces]|uniref:DUF742 domain-containing protein n=1 Tax=Streptomyces chengmaiensis TaxID=3040919 RepID=A0ABT6HK51_9ACTN|nr:MULTISPECIES: DUF742 domain-containing protein [Streptomyces]MDH2389001.1 DUF742 domain-containing protein [Streptomyces chengmaiensis]WRQ82717.1 DUF742 domain-containing protein [Streptomyces sp. MUM 178J]
MTPSRPGRDRGLVRPYVITEGRAHPTRNTVDLVTLVTAVRDRPLNSLNPEKRRVMELCGGGALSVAEVAAHLSLAVSVTKVLLSDLIDSGHLTVRPPIPKAQLPDARLLQEVLHGLRSRF